MAALVLAGCSKSPSSLKVTPAEIRIEGTSDDPETVTVNLTLKNNGGAPLTILNAKTTCSCAVVGSVPTSPLKASEQVDLPIKIDIPEFGISQQWMRIVTDSNETPQIDVPIRVVAPPQPLPVVVMSPRELSYLVNGRDARLLGTLSIRTQELADNEPWLSNPNAEIDGCEAVLADPPKESPPTSGTVVRDYTVNLMTTDEYTGDLTRAGTVGFASDEASNRTPVIPVRIRFAPRFRPIPQRVDLKADIDHPGQFFGTVVIISDEDSEWGVEPSASGPAWLKIAPATESDPSARTKRLTITASRDETPKEIDSISVTLDIKHQQPAAVEFNVRFPRNASD